MISNLVYASSSSVYGANTTKPFSVHDNVDHPLSLYAASKNLTNLWLTLIVTCLILAQLALDFLQFMAHGEGLIWLYLNSLKQS